MRILLFSSITALCAGILLAELLAVGIEGIVHGANERQIMRRIAISRSGEVANVVFLDRCHVLTDSVDIIHLLVQNVKKKLRTQRRFRRIYAECG